MSRTALGRSPYDILVLGTGEVNPHEPPQSYDERGRPYNAETRRINRNIIRAHNEVMQVIGVAEPDSLMTAESEADNQLIQQLHEDKLGHKLFWPMRTIGLLGLWGAEPLRQSVLLFRRFDDYLPWQNFRQDYGGKSLLRALTDGLPAGLADNFLRHVSLSWKARNRRLVALKYVRLHLQAFMCLQRLSIIPAYPILPSPFSFALFFVPFSGHSPIFRLPSFPAEVSFGAVAQWVAEALICVVPMAAFYCFLELRDNIMHKINYIVFDALDVPSNPPVKRPMHEYDPFTGDWRLAGLPTVEVLPPRPPVPPPPQPQPEQTSTSRGERPTIPPPPAESQRPFTDTVDNSDSNVSRRNAIDGQEEAGAGSGSSEATPTQDQQSTTPTPGSPNAAPRRRNTVSSGGGGVDGYNSEEEDFELSATLISFDVEAGSAGDAPPNAWSAELRQTAAVSIGFEPNEAYTGDVDDDGLGPEYDEDGYRRGGRLPGEYNRGVYYPNVPAPFYSDTMLSRLPATIFAAGAASVISSILLSDCESAVVRLLAHSWRNQQGLPVADLHGFSVLPFLPGWTLSLNATNHFAFVILLETAVQATGTLVTLGMAWLFRGSHPKWTFWRVVREKLGYPPKEDNPKLV
ncbi:hypothetical protein SEUCBS140593_006727 [Sporothrix eucalyptigena]|uniref:Uncharacterized protein n=1 Tax=Sporothrix eucalyptigena TaxID=1812306 RepID=A0ABP0C7B3_9PEZI